MPSKPSARMEELAVSAEMELSKDTRHLSHLASDGATDEELSAILGVSLDALKPYTVLITKARAEHTMRIRRAFLAAAEAGDPFALGYLAKNFLEKP